MLASQRWLDRAGEMTLVPDVKHVVARVSRKAESPYKLTPHFTEGSSLISSRFFPLAPHRADTSLNSTSIPPLRGLLGEGNRPPPRYCSLISPVVLRRLTTAANSHLRNHLRHVLHPGCPLVSPTLDSFVVVTFLISSF